jgi:hypothetical protein
VFCVIDGSSPRNLKGTTVVHLSASHPDWMLVWEDERWFYQFAQLALNSCSQDGIPLALEQEERRKEDKEAKAVACYGGVEVDLTRVSSRMRRCHPG